MPAQVKTVTAGRPRAQALPLPLKAVAVGLGVCLIAAAAHISIPFWPVPMTMQSGTVLLLSAVYGSGLAEATLAAYLVAGALGLPVFSAGAG
ncbi:MAG TPA: biotin transporter BioY, partial [Acidisoma sp.]|nr:biotin transporter BioY [Acidisoma sp.]